jgi:biotin synthase-related radical SAM superfamily protein
MLSRVSWPVFPTRIVLERVKAAREKRHIGRVCIQALNYPRVLSDLLGLASSIYGLTKMPISVSCQPLGRINIVKLAEAGVERVGIALDAASEEIFDRVKGRFAEGPYTWKKQFQLLRSAVEVFGKGNVSTHLIVGLGETEKEMVATIQRCVDMGVLPALFAFTPIPGTALQNWKQPAIHLYRRIQVARHLIVEGLVRFDAMTFDEHGELAGFGVGEDVLADAVQTGRPFLTSGCPDCNRPYYNERPGGPVYNCPKPLTQEELSSVVREMALT